MCAVACLHGEIIIKNSYTLYHHHYEDDDDDFEDFDDDGETITAKWYGNLQHGFLLFACVALIIYPKLFIK